MKIFILPAAYPDQKHPQKHIFVYEQAKALAKLGHEIIILHVSLLPSIQLLSKTNRNIEEHDDGFAKRYTISCKTFWEKKYPRLNRDLFVKKARRLFDYALEREGRPDIVYAHFSCWAGYAASCICKEKKLPLVTLEHGSMMLKTTWKKCVLAGVMKTVVDSDRFLCVSQGLKDSLQAKLGKDKEITVVPNMIDDRFTYQEKPEKEGFVFLAIGNLFDHKGFGLLIDAFVDAFPAEAAVTLRIGGDGPERNRLMEKVHQKGRETQIKFLGRLIREQTVEEYIYCDCFVLPSRFETFGLVYREALATGRPIITTDHGGFNDDDWHDEYGYKIPVDDQTALTNALKNMVTEHNTFSGKTMSELCLHDCAAKVISKKIADILEDAKKKYD